MPTEYTIDPQRRIVYSTTTGMGSAREFMLHQRQLREDPSFASDFDQLYDLRGLENHDASATELQQLAEQSSFGAGARRAFVVSKDVHFGLVRMFELMRQGGDKILVFRDMDEARRWLGLNES